MGVIKESGYIERCMKKVKGQNIPGEILDISISVLLEKGKGQK